MADTYQEQLAREEAKLARMIRTEPTGPAEKVNAATRALRATAARVRELRAKAEPSAEVRMAGMAARRRMEDEQKTRAAERAKREPARKAAKLVASFAHPELRGLTLTPSRLSDGEGEDLLALVTDRCEGDLSGRRENRYRRLAGRLAGDEQAFDQARKEQATADTAERARLDSLPVRCYRGKGGAFLPGFLLGWLLDSEPGSFSVIDAGVLATFVLAVEQGATPFARSTVEGGRIVLDTATGFAFRPGMNPDGELGERRVRDAVVYLAANDWLDTVATSEGRTSVGLGPRTRRLIEEATVSDVTVTA
jgi:hypothetical protein